MDLDALLRLEGCCGGMMLVSEDDRIDEVGMLRPEFR